MYLSGLTGRTDFHEARCERHRGKPLSLLCALCNRLTVEADIVTRVVDALLAADYALGTDAEGESEKPPTRDRAEILTRLKEVDDERLTAYDGSTSPQWVRFVYGNSGYDVISDYTIGLGGVLTPVLEYAESLT